MALLTKNQKVSTLRNKVGVEVWQIFTILTAILSLASTFLWYGLIIPNSLKADFEIIDRTKAILFNTYQEKFLSLASLGAHSVNANLETCDIAYNQGDVNYQELRDVVSKAEKNYLETEYTSKINRKQFIGESGLNSVSESYKTLVDESKQIIDASEKVNKLHINVSNNIKQACIEENLYQIRPILTDYLNEILKVELHDEFKIKGEKLKESLFISDPQNTSVWIDTTIAILQYKPEFENIYASLQPFESRFIESVQKLESWQKQKDTQNPYLNLNKYYIYDTI
jgi:hypothetical protein